LGSNAIWAFGAKVDPDTLEWIWFKRLTDPPQSGEWDHPDSARQLAPCAEMMSIPSRGAC